MNNPTKRTSESAIVFGANGFLGSVITKRLYDSGYEVLPIIRPGANISRLQDLGGTKILEVEASEWRKIVGEHKPSIVICAQWNGVLKQDRENLELQNSNIEPILNIAIATKESGAGNFICFGSQAEAKESTEPIFEEFYDSGTSAYGNAKTKLYKHLAFLFENSDCRFIWARVFSVYGPSDFSDSLLTRLFESQVSGNKLAILNPSTLWSFLYQDDFASAIEQILNNPTVASIVNIGNPKFHEIREIVAMCQGSTLGDSVENKASSTNLGFFPDLTKLIAIGWTPTITLEEGIERTRKAFIYRNETK